MQTVWVLYEYIYIYQVNYAIKHLLALRLFLVS